MKKERKKCMFGYQKQDTTQGTVENQLNQQMPGKPKVPNAGIIKKTVIGIVVAAVVALTAMQSFYSLQEDEYAVIQTFGYA